MSATDALRAAGKLTSRYLSALWVRGLLKLGVVVLFLGIGFSGLQIVTAPFDPETVDEPAELWTYAWLFAGGIGVYAALRYLAATLEFVFVTSLRTRQLALRRYLRSNLVVGLWLLLFRAAVAIGGLAVVSAATALIVGTDLAAFEAATSQQGVAVAATVAVTGFGWLAVDTLTTGFVVPIMQQTRCGPIAGWRRFLGIIGANWTGVLAFLAVAWVVGFALWLILFGVGFAAMFVGVLLFVLIATALTELHSAFEPVVVGLLVVGVMSYYYAVALIEAPVRSYVRYYGLYVLGETDSELDLIEDYRTELAASVATDSEQPADDHADPASTAVDTDDPADR